METRANYVLIGVFTLAVILGAFGFVWWFQRAGDAGSRASYEVVFDGSVSGLRTGSAVNFNGVRVGEVYDIQLDATDPRRVYVQIGVASHIPVRADTKAGLETQGLTGIAVVALIGGKLDAPPIVAESGKLPRITAETSQMQDLMQAARTVMSRVDKMLVENEQQIKEMIVEIGAAGKSVKEAADTLGNEIGAAGKSVKEAADTLGNSAEPTLKEYRLLAQDARRAVGDIARFFRELEKNPSQLVFGKKNTEAPAQQRR